MRSLTTPPGQEIVHGPDAVSVIAERLAARDVRRPLVVASRTLGRKTDAVERICAEIGAVDVFDDIRQHVPRQSVLAAAERCREVRADAVVSVGGGSPIDCAKAVRMCLAADDDDATLDRQRVRVTAEGRVVPAPVVASVPHVAVPTTLSGAEFTGLAGVTDTERRVKDLYVGHAFAPQVVVLDPAVTRHTPAWLWAASGIRAVDHVVEGVYSPRHHPVADALLLSALRILAADLLDSARAPDDLEARERCQLAAWMAIMHLHNVSMGLSHALGHQLGARFDIPHGVTSCILLPPVMDFNRPVTADRQALLAGPLGLDVGELGDEEAAMAAATAVRRLIADADVPSRLVDVGVGHEQFTDLAEEALDDFASAGNPRPASVEDIVEILAAAS